MTDIEAVTEYGLRRDPEAFKHLVETYQGMVFSACNRILGNAADAEEASQEAFLRLANQAKDIKINPASWLYGCALHVAKDRLKSDVARKAREKAWSQEQPKSIEKAEDFHEILPVVDECIDELPEEEKELLLQYYFKGKNQTAIGDEQGVSRQAIKQRLDKTVNKLREKLKSKGIVVPAALLLLFFGSESVHAAVPTALTASLIKIGLAGVGKGAVASSATVTGLLATAKAKLIAAALTCVVVVTGVVIHNETKKEPVQENAPVVKKEDTVKDKSPTFKYGFRYDPMKWVAESKTVDAALIRKQVFNKPKDGDEELIQAEITKILSNHGEAGNIGDIKDVGATGYAMLKLLRMGYDPKSPKIQKTAAFVQANEMKDGAYGSYGIEAFFLTGVGDKEKTMAAVRKLAATFEGQFWEGCPGTPAGQLKSLRHCRGDAEVEAAIERGMAWFAEKVGPYGGPVGRFPWDVIECATILDHRRAKEIVEKMVPAILRLQEADGGYPLVVFSALKKFGLIEELRQSPSVPLDWKVTRTLPLPDHSAKGLAWYDGLMWTGLSEKNQIVGISLQDGKVQKTLTVPGVRSVTTWDGKLAAVQDKPYGIHELDIETGETVRSVKGHPAYSKGLRAFATENTGRKTCELWDAPIESLAADGEAVWYYSTFSNMLLKIDVKQNVLEWGENPLKEDRWENVGGLAHDGKSLWLLDAKKKRLCMIRKRPEGEDSGKPQREGDKVWIKGLPLRGGDGNGIVKGLEVLLVHSGVDIGYERLMGLTGMAFITQADAQHRWEGQLDIGWWPLDTWGVLLRLDFLSQATGIHFEELGKLTFTPEEFKAVMDNLPSEYRRTIDAKVRASIDAGEPLLNPNDFGFVICGYDGDEERVPLLGRCASETQDHRLQRMGSWPLGLIKAGKKMKRIDLKDVDTAALRHAISLIRDKAGPLDHPWKGRRTTGQKSFAVWAAFLRNHGESTQNRHHANMRLNLALNRKAAITFLQEMAQRQDPDAAQSLKRAIALYNESLGLINQISTTGLQKNMEKRIQLAEHVEHIAAVELKAADAMERALSAMPDATGVSAATLRVVTAREAAKLSTLDPFYNIHCDLLPGPEQAVFEKVKRSTTAEWDKSFADLGVKHIGDTRFAVIALRDGDVVGWLRFYRAGKCNLRSRVQKAPPAGRALVICAGVVDKEELPHGTARRMIEKAIDQCKRLGLAEVYAVASPDIRAYAAWSNKFMLKDYTACGFEVLEQTPADPGALYDMVKGAHGKDSQESVREAGITDTSTANYCLVKKKCP